MSVFNLYKIINDKNEISFKNSYFLVSVLIKLVWLQIKNPRNNNDFYYFFKNELNDTVL